MFKKVAIVGLGLIGGSVARMLKRKNETVHITAYARKPESLQSAIDEGYIDDAFSIHNIDCRAVDLFIVATPVLSSIPIIQSLLDNPQLHPDALIIDAGSVKKPIEDAVIHHTNAHQFIGCHPMAGSEKSGFTHSSHTILVNAWVIITPHSKNKDDDIIKIKHFWEMLECKVHITDAKHHDKMVACSSHLPHVASAVLMESVLKCNSNHSLQMLHPFTGKGFRDMTRLAGGSPDMWADIVLLNSENIHACINEYIHSLQEVQTIIQNASLHNDRDLLYNYFDDIRKKWNKYYE